ncbi:MAG: type II toxin-antitoxin system VapC family toxin [Opitutae bacterium]|nr:type II toxin-antitoxin system VapC family toxin [Opitutae bacterium]
MIFDSAFFVALHRELQRGAAGPAHKFHAAHAAEVPGMSEITGGELARGFATRSAWADFCDRFVIYPFNDAVAWRAAGVFRDRPKRGVLTGENALWIAATALDAGGALVTRNEKHFREIRGLKVLGH